MRAVDAHDQQGEAQDRERPNAEGREAPGAVARRRCRDGAFHGVARLRTLVLPTWLGAGIRAEVPRSRAWRWTSSAGSAPRQGADVDVVVDEAGVEVVEVDSVGVVP